MKTTRVLTAVSAAALLGISSFALAQSSGGGSGSSGAPSSGTMQRDQSAPSSGSTSPSKNGASSDRMTQDKGGMKSDQAQGKDSQKSTTTGQSQMDKDSQKSDRAQGKDSQKSTTTGQSQMGKDSQKSDQTMGKDSQKSTTGPNQMGKDTQKGAQKAPGATDSKSQMSREGQKSGTDTTVGAASSGGVNLTTEQRTTIRQTVLTSNAPRVDSVNFNVSVGTVVPRTVRVVAVPDTIVRINPRWKGYRYFVYSDEIIIVEPRTLKIVAVLDV